MKRKDTNLLIRISETDKKALAEISEKIDVPASQIVREAVRERISDILKATEIDEELKNAPLNSEAK